MIRDISVEEAMRLEQAIFVDARSEGEFAEATIPGAINIPLFDNEERAVVGTLYKEKGTRDAKIKGLEIVAPKLSAMVSSYAELKKRYRHIIIFCWRGGMRSQSIAMILELMDIHVYRIVDGYKGYRAMVNRFFAIDSLPQKVVVLRGLTGTGKTDIIQGLISAGLPAIDLEGMAHNRGSVFGAVGMKPPPSQKMFDALLMNKLIEYKDSKYIIVECESKKVGRIYLPDVLMQGMRDGLQILIYDDLESRVQRIIGEYTQETAKNTEQLKKAIDCLENTLGQRKVELLKAKVAAKDYHDVVRYLLTDYYDPLYKYPDQPTDDYNLSIKNSEIFDTIHKIKAYLEYYFDTREALF